MRYLPVFCVLLLVAFIEGNMGCANIQAPLGGPKDTTAPVLLKTIPANKTLQFKGNSIQLLYNEYIELENASTKAIFNPPLVSIPQIDRKLKIVSIRLKDTLTENTTYSVRLDGVIKDLNEGNPVGDYTYVFSTGNYIDSAVLEGMLVDAETGFPDSTLSILLHRNISDTAVKTLPPSYITHPNGKGKFRFEYLAPGTYNLFALADNGFKVYNDTTVLFAFANSSLTIGTQTGQPVQLYAFKAAKEVPKTVAPSTETSAPSGRNKEKQQEPKRLTYQCSAAAGDQDLLEKLTLSFPRKLAAFDSSQILLSDTFGKPIGNLSYALDTSGKILSIAVPWKDNAYYRLLLQKGFATDTMGLKVMTTDTLNFKTKAESEYGAVKFTFSSLPMEAHPLLQWTKNGEVIATKLIRMPIYSEKLVAPGQYNVRIVLDTNQNGTWDTGNYTAKKQPEKVLPVWQVITIRPNWDNEFTIDLAAPMPEKEKPTVAPPRPR